MRATYRSRRHAATLIEAVVALALIAAAATAVGWVGLSVYQQVGSATTDTALRAAQASMRPLAYSEGRHGHYPDPLPQTLPEGVAEAPVGAGEGVSVSRRSDVSLAFAALSGEDGCVLLVDRIDGSDDLHVGLAPTDGRCDAATLSAPGP